MKRTTLAEYESGRHIPPLEALLKLSGFFSISIDDLVRTDLEKADLEEIRQGDSTRNIPVNGKLRILAITTDKSERENIEFVSHQEVRAGYLQGYRDIEYIGSLPKFNLPNLGTGTFRAFEIKGSSMLPFPSGSVVVGGYVERWQEIRSKRNHIIVTLNDGMVFKEVRNRVKEEGKLLLISHNKEYPPYKIDIAEVVEVWEQKIVLLYQDLVLENKLSEFREISSQLQRIEEQVTRIGKHIS